MDFVDAKIRRHMFRHFAGVAGQHNGLLHPGFPKRPDRLFCARLLDIGDHDMSGVLPIDRHMNNSSGMMAVDPLYAQPLHQFRVSGRHTYAVHFRHDAVSADLLNIRHAAPVDLFAVRPLQAPADGV